MSTHPRRSAADVAAIEASRRAASLAGLGKVTWFARDEIIRECAAVADAEGCPEVATKILDLGTQTKRTKKEADDAQ